MTRRRHDVDVLGEQLAAARGLLGRALVTPLGMRGECCDEPGSSGAPIQPASKRADAVLRHERAVGSYDGCDR